jgi:hypothetical protein
MPISDYRHIPQVLDEVYALQPERTIELGIGFGKWGVLLREVLDAMYGRCAPYTWRRQIWGVEGWRDYLNPCWQAYSGVDVGNFMNENTWPLAGWDLVMMMDSLEHLFPEEGRDFLAKLVEQNKRVIISVPNGFMPQDEAVYGNELEKHRTTFHGPEFDRYDHKVLHLGLCRVVSIKGQR